MRPLPMVLLSALGAALAPGCHDHCHEESCPQVTPDADPTAPDAATEVVEETRTLAPAQFDEGIFVAGPGDRIVIGLAASAGTLDWNLHGHGGGFDGTHFEEFGVQNVSYVFEPPAQTSWYLLLRNAGDAQITVETTLEITGGSWSGWE